MWRGAATHASPGSSKVCQTIKIGIMTAIAATCKWCGQEFSSKTKCEKHAKTCRPFACGQCDERLKSKTALQEHMKTYGQQFQCNLCNIDPSMAAAQLEEHCYRDHDIPIQCTACDKMFKDPYVRKRHAKQAPTGGIIREAPHRGGGSKDGRRWPPT